MTYRRSSSPRGHFPRHSYSRLSSRHFGHGGSRARRGDVRAAILGLLAERPMHGYEMIKELEERTRGVWTPSAGSIYPTLQLLEESGLIAGTDDGGKRRFELTDSGREESSKREGDAPGTRSPTAPTRSSSGSPTVRSSSTPRSPRSSKAGSDEQRGKVAELLDETRRKIYAVLADSRITNRPAELARRSARGGDRTPAGDRSPSVRPSPTPR